ncbi:hypothetical protein GQ44DRAFT_302913 [Phaeosphaeriaceae sp. PMI808]|nr:hypothetical protein GQ44DRAFT_302913 [Phaeosphaeriaceae sp. PMI808]
MMHRPRKRSFSTRSTPCRPRSLSWKSQIQLWRKTLRIRTYGWRIGNNVQKMQKQAGIRHGLTRPLALPIRRQIFDSYILTTSPFVPLLSATVLLNILLGMMQSGEEHPFCSLGETHGEPTCATMVERRDMDNMIFSLSIFELTTSIVLASWEYFFSRLVIFAALR